MSRVSGRAARSALLALEISGVVLATLAGLAGYFVWRLQQGPVSLSLFKRSAEFAIERSLGQGFDAQIARAYLSLSESPGGVDLTLEAVAILGPDGSAAAELPRVELGFSADDFFSASFGPRRLLVLEPAIKIVRRKDRTIALDSDPAKARTFRLLTGGAFYRSAFESAELKDAKVHFIDEASGKVWTSDRATAAIVKTSAGFDARLDGEFDAVGEPGALSLRAIFTEASGVVTAELRLDRAPVGDLFGAFYGPRMAILSAPFTGAASVALDRAGAVLSSRIDGEVGRGELLFGDRRFAVDQIGLAAAFDPAKNLFEIERADFKIGGSRGVFRGAVRIINDDKRAFAGLGFRLDGVDLVIDTHGLLPQPLALASLALTGAYDAAERRLALSDLRAFLLDVALGGTFSLAAGARGNSPEVKADLALEGELDPQRLLLAWPVNLGLGARDFVATRLPTARIHEVAARIDLAEGAVAAGRPMPDGALHVAFSIADATAFYAPTMTPLSAASGTALLSGNRFLIQDARGRIGAIEVEEAEVDFSVLAPKGAPVYFRFAAAGGARDILGVLNQAPLAVLKTTNLSPDQFSGKARVRAQIIRPNRREVPREDYEYSAKATFDDVTIAEFYNGVDITSAVGAVDLASRSLRIVAKADLGKSPIDLEWTQPLTGSAKRGRFKFSGTLDSSTGDVFGVPTRQMLFGPVPFTATAAGRLGAIETLSVDADFTGAALTVDAFGWRKAQGVAAAGALIVDFAKDEVRLRKIHLAGEEMAVDGAIRFGPQGAIESAAFERFFLGNSADFSLSAARAESGQLEVSLTGAFLNAGALIAQVVGAAPDADEEKPFAWGRGVMLRARLDRLAARGGAVYRDVTLDLRHEGGRLQGLDFSARTLEGAPLAIGLKRTGAETGPSQAIEARTDDIGSLLAGVFGVTSVKGGEGSMQIMASSQQDVGRPGLVGVCEARGMRVVKAPLLARIFAAGSFGGLADLLNDEGISLNEAHAKFGYQKGLLTIDEARASGPSVGITGAGSIATGEGGAVNLMGAVAPAYQVNSLLGKTPLIGDLFVSREGEGIVALSYVVNGPSNEPTVTVNPLSALTPGFLRRMFEGGRGPAERGAPPPEGAVNRP